MVNVKIIDTGEIKTLSVIDAKSGIDWSADMIGNSDGFDGFDEETELQTMRQESYDWWVDLLQRYEAADEAVHSYRRELNDGGVGDEFETIINDLLGCDLENEPENMLRAIEWHKSNA